MLYHEFVHKEPTKQAISLQCITNKQYAINYLLISHGQNYLDCPSHSDQLHLQPKPSRKKGKESKNKWDE